MTSPAPSALPSVPAFSDSVPAAALEVVLLARDQEAVVADLVAAVVGHLDAHMELPWILTVADHASCDHTFSAACASAATTNERKASARLAPTGGEVRAIRLDEQLDRRDLRARFADSEGAGGPGGGASPTDTLTFLRGTQLADAAGKVAFETVYPGWYQGRTVHIHVKVHVGGKQIHTGQLFFDDTFTDAVFAANTPYSARPARQLRNDGDGIFGGGGAQSILAAAKNGSGYAASLVMAVKPT